MLVVDEKEKVKRTIIIKKLETPKQFKVQSPFYVLFLLGSIPSLQIFYPIKKIKKIPLRASIDILIYNIRFEHICSPNQRKAVIIIIYFKFYIQKLIH